MVLHYLVNSIIPRLGRNNSTDEAAADSFVPVWTSSLPSGPLGVFFILDILRVSTLYPQA